MRLLLEQQGNADPPTSLAHLSATLLQDEVENKVNEIFAQVHNPTTLSIAHSSHHRLLCTFCISPIVPGGRE
ncbi:hypothetical protein EON65_25215 [archaeon]|nr:MAG: hypothetical protein EON65_25215 [archaeon]